MRLYLSSFRLGTAPEHLVHLVGEGAHVAVVANAIDDEPSDVREAKVRDEVRALERLGLHAEELDLRTLEGASSEVVEENLASVDGLWVRGGNVFVLRAALAFSGADEAIVRLLAADALVYAGYSAGPCVLAPSLAGLESVDDVEGPRTAYGRPALMTGLGVLDRAVVPHCGNPTHPESAACDALADAYAAAGVVHVRLRDGEALVVDGTVERIVGRPADVADLLYPVDS